MSLDGDFRRKIVALGTAEDPLHFVLDLFLSADADGRAKIAADFFDAVTALAKFATDAITNSFLLKAVQDGAFAATSATRALFADDFVVGEEDRDVGLLQAHGAGGGRDWGAGQRDGDRGAERGPAGLRARPHHGP